MMRVFLAVILTLFASASFAADTFQLGDKPEKAAPTTADRMLITDSAAGNAVKRIDIANLPVSTPIQTAINSAVATKQDPLSGNCTGQILVDFSQAGAPSCEALPFIPSLIEHLSNIDVTGAGLGDALIYDGAGGWEIGQITGTDDQTAAEVPFSSAGFTATNTLDAILELDTEKASISNISFTAGILSDLKITLTDTSTSPIINDTVTYGDVDDDLRVGSIQYYGLLLANKADKTNVLELDNTSVFTPDADYEPATKKYVDDNAGSSTAATVSFAATGGISATDVQSALAEVDTEKANKDNILFTAGALSDLKITLTDLSATPLVDDTVTYGDTDDHLRLGSIQYYGALLAGKADTSDLASQSAFEAAFFTLPSGSSSYVATPWTYDDETCTAGQYAIDSSYLYVCVASGNIDRIATASGWNPSPTYPLLSSTTVDSSGTEADMVFDQTVTTTGYTSGDFVLNCTTANSGADIALSTPTGSGANWSFSTGATTIYTGDSCTVSYTYRANGIEDGTGDDLQSITDDSVTVVGATPPAEDWTPATIEFYEGSQAPAVRCNIKASIYDSNGDMVAVTDGWNYSSANDYVSDDVAGTPTDIVASSTYYLAITDDSDTNTGCYYAISYATSASTYGRSSEGGTYTTPADPITLPIATPYAGHDTPLARVKNASGEILLQWSGTVGGVDNSLHYAETSAFETPATSESTPQ